MSDRAMPAPGTIPRTRWSVIWLLTLTLFSALTVGGLLAPLQEAAKADLGLSDMDIGLLAGMAMAAPIAVLSLPIAWLVDHGTRSKLLIILSSFWAIGTIATAFVDGFAGLFAARLFSAVGAGTGFPVVVSLLADVTLPAKRGRSMLLVSIGAWAGVAAAYAIGGTLFGYLAAHAGSGLLGLAPWREVHLIVGIGAAVAILPLFLIREPARHEVERTGQSIRDTLAAFNRRRGFVGALMIGQFTGGMAEVAAAIWIGTVLIRQHGVPPGSFGGWVGLVILGSGVVGSVIGGFSADAARRLRMRGAILLPATIATAVTIPAGAYSIMPTVGGFAGVLFLLLIGGTIVNLVSSAAVAVLIPNEDRAMTLAAMKIAGSIIGAGLAPPLVVWLSRAFAGPGAIGEALAVMGVVTGIVSLAGFWLAMRTAPIEVARDPAATIVPASD